MKNIIKIIFNVRMFFIILFLISSTMFYATSLLNSRIGKILGAECSTNLSLKDFLKGEIVLNKTFIKSSEKFNYYPTAAIYCIEVKPVWTTLFTNNKVIDIVHIGGITINIIDNNKGNNLKELKRHITNYFNKNNNINKNNVLLKHFAVTGITINNYQNNRLIKSEVMDNIFINNVESKDSFIETLVLATGIETQKKIYGNSIFNIIINQFSSDINYKKKINIAYNQ